MHFLAKNSYICLCVFIVDSLQSDFLVIKLIMVLLKTKNYFLFIMCVCVCQHFIQPQNLGFWIESTRGLIWWQPKVRSEDRR